MWLLKLHFAISVLCLLTFVGFTRVFKETIQKNGYMTGEKQKTKLTTWLVFFVPIMNLGLVITIFVMIAMKKEDLEKKMTELKQKDSGDEKQS